MEITAIGLGQAGGNLAAEFFRRGYRALALNTAETDLAALEPGGLVPMLPPERRLYIGLDGYDGAGADPNYGRECIREHADLIKEHVQRLGQDADAIVVCAGLGGGTGSALATLVEVLDGEELPLVGLMTLPTGSESGLAKVNAVRSVNDVLGTDMFGWIFVDNGRLAALNPNLSVADYYDRVNAKVIAPLDALNRLNARPNVRPIRSFDGEDFRKLLLAGGILNYAEREVRSLDVDEVLAGVRDSVESSDLMPGGFDVSRMSYLGLILEAPADILAETSFASFETIHEALKQQTDGAAIYQGIYRLDEHDATPTLRMLAVTQSLPNRIRDLLSDAKREGQAIGSKAQEDLPSLELGEVQKLDLFRTSARANERPRRPRAGRRAPAPLDLPSDIGIGRRTPTPDLPNEGSTGRRAPPKASAPKPAPSSATDAPPSPATIPPSSPLTSRPLALPPADAPTEAGVLPLSTSEAAKGPPPRARRPAGRRRPGAALAGRPTTSPLGAAPVPPEPVSATSDVSTGPVGTPMPFAAEDDDALRRITEIGADADAVKPAAEGPKLDSDELELVDELALSVAGDDPLADLRRPPPADPDADTGDLPSPTVYQRLVAEYLKTDDLDKRRKVQRRLEEDSLSDNAVVRYYAVEAMSVLGRSVFGNALLAATEDDDEAVRSLAVQALSTP